MAYSWSTGEECTKGDTVVAGRNELCGNSNPLQGWTFDGTTWWNKDLYSQSMCQLHVMKMLWSLISSSVIKIEHKTKQKKKVGMEWEKNKNDIKCGKCKQKMNADMRPFDEVKKCKWKLFYYVFKANWCGGCEASSEGIMHRDGTKELKPPKNCCHSNHRYHHETLLSIVSDFQDLFLASSKINHILASLGPPGSKYIG